MRTTVTIDDDIARLISDIQHRDRTSFKRVVNDALRRGLTATAPQLSPYQIRPHHSGPRPGVDVTALNRLADEPESDAALGRERG